MTMNEQQIGEALLEITNAIINKTGRHPAIGPNMTVDNMGRCTIMIYADRDDQYGRTGCAKGNTFEDAITDAWRIINAIPSPEDHARAKFTQAVGAAIEAGKEAGVDLEYINPLKEMMNRISENAITCEDY